MGQHPPQVAIPLRVQERSQDENAGDADGDQGQDDEGEK
jgi:hypothetical protein